MNDILSTEAVAAMRETGIQWSLCDSHEALRAEVARLTAALAQAHATIERMAVDAEAHHVALAQARREALEDFRPRNADVLNQELRENYGAYLEVDPYGDWCEAIRGLVDGVDIFAATYEPAASVPKEPAAIEQPPASVPKEQP